MKDFINDYVNYLKKLIKLRKIDNSHELILPFDDRNGDSLVCYIDEIGNDKYLISDDGYIINTLIDYGLNISNKRRETIKEICLQSGVKLSNDEITILATDSDLASKVHTLAMTLLRIDDMYLVNQNRVLSYFVEDVINFFDTNDIFYSKNVSFTGRSGFTQLFDFTFQKNKLNPERLCKVINIPNRNNMQSAIFSWTDVESTRDKSSKCLVILNDNQEINPEIISGFSSYGITPVLWSKISDYKHLFN